MQALKMKIKKTQEPSKYKKMPQAARETPLLAQMKVLSRGSGGSHGGI